jgi:TPR repeat protein
VLGTLWPEHADTYTALPEKGRADTHSHTRTLLSGRLIALPDSFDASANERAQEFARTGDGQLANALQHATDGRVTQFLAGAPELLRRYESAVPPVRALLDVAMDARRLGAGIQLPISFLEQAVEDYLSDDEYDQLADNWLEDALADTARPVHGNLAPLRRNRRRSRDTATHPVQTYQSSLTYRLADYLEQHGRTERKLLCPPASFWQAAHDHLSPPDLVKLAEAARHRYRNRWTCLLLQQAAEAGNITATTELAWFVNEIDSDLSIRFYEHAVDAGDTDAMILLAQCRDADDLDIEGAEELYWRAASAGNDEALEVLSQRLDVFGIVEGIIRFYKRAIEGGETQHSEALIEWQKEMERLEETDWSVLENRHYAWDAENALILLDRWLVQTGVRNESQSYRKAAASAEYTSLPISHGITGVAIQEALEDGNTELAGWLTELQELDGNYEGAERTVLRIVDAGGAPSLQHLTFGAENERWPNFIDIWPNGLEPDGTPSAPWSLP